MEYLSYESIEYLGSSYQAENNTLKYNLISQCLIYSQDYEDIRYSTTTKMLVSRKEEASFKLSLPYTLPYKVNISPILKLKLHINHTFILAFFWASTASFLKPSISFCNCSFSCWSFNLCSLTKPLFSLSESRMLCKLQIISWQRDFSSSELKEKKSCLNSRRESILQFHNATLLQLQWCEDRGH